MYNFQVREIFKKSSECNYRITEFEQNHISVTAPKQENALKHGRLI